MLFRITPFVYKVILLIIACFCGRAFLYPENDSNQNYTSVRARQALDFRERVLINAQNNNNLKETHGGVGDDPLLCAVFVTMSRYNNDEIHPLEISLGSALSNLTAADRKQLDLHIYITNVNPEDHPMTYGSPLFGLADEVSTPRHNNVTSAEELRELIKLELRNEWMSRTPFDYSYAIRRCHENSKAPYMGLFSDNVLFAEDWFIEVVKTMKSISGNDTATWLDLQMNDTQDTRCHSSKSQLSSKMLRLAFCSAIIIIYVIFRSRIAYKLWAVMSCKASLPLSKILRSMVIVLLVAFFFFRSIRFAILQQKTAMHVPWEDTGVGMIFPSSSVPGIIMELTSGYADDLDLALERHTRQTGLKRYDMNIAQILPLSTIYFSNVVDQVRQILGLPSSDEQHSRNFCPTPIIEAQVHQFEKAVNPIEQGLQDET